MESRESAFEEDRLYDQFPSGASEGFGPDEGFDTWVRVNDPSLFTEEALKHPAIQAFVGAPFNVTYAQFKSSHRESEYFIHKPNLAMTGQVSEILGVVDGISADDPRTPIATLVLNHEQTLALRITRSIVVSGSGQAGQLVIKEPGAD
ncbi:MAG: hypothetical protein ACXWNR_05025 [Candidatus Limnocylindrales bacterium]